MIGKEARDQYLQREMGHNPYDLENLVPTHLPQLQPEQMMAFDTIMSAIINQRGELYFINAPGGTGKTFLISLILAKVRSQKNIA